MVEEAVISKDVEKTDLEAGDKIKMTCPQCGKRTLHEKKRGAAKTVWKCQECYTVRMG
ncbi:MAG: hypothetical protein ACOC55_01100 [Candidatus Natronoplasma sp.]